MKVSIRHPSGFEIEFEGDQPEFERITQFLSELPTVVSAVDKQPSYEGGEADSGSSSSGAALDAREVLGLLDAVGARTDIERVTVMAQAAVDAGLGGVDYDTVNRLYTGLGFPKPAKLRATFSNAKVKGYVRSVGQGRWAPTVTGENFARHGIREKGRTPSRRGSRRATQSVVETTGGESD